MSELLNGAYLVTVQALLQSCAIIVDIDSGKK